MLFILLIFLPIFGVAIWYPFSNADVNGTVNYRSTETLYFNEYWYEFEEINRDHDITFSVQSSPSVISFAIYNHPYNELPTTTKTGSYKDVILVTAYGAYEYYSIFLNSQSTIRYNFTATNQIDFFIVDGDNFNKWDYGGYPHYYEYLANILAANGEITVDVSQDYYVVWYNDGSSSINVDATINYTALDVPDITAAYYYVENTDSAQGTFNVPSKGTWYFFIYFDPMNSLESSTSITFDVTYDTGITAIDRWTDAQPVLIILVIFLIILILLALIARGSQKKREAKVKATKPARKDIEKQRVAETPKCERCGSNLRKGSNFCAKCGGKVMGRKTEAPKVKTPSGSKSCAYCGNKITADENFCKYCGTKIA